MRSKLYEGRPLVAGYPELERLAAEYYAVHQDDLSPHVVDEIIGCIEMIVPPGAVARKVVVVGCGPKPESVRALVARGYNATGVEPVERFVAIARSLVGEDRVVSGCAEELPFECGSQNVVWMLSVLEHVDSVEKSLAEAYRVLSPGGVLYIQTTNRWKFSILGRNDEFRTPFFNWFPKLVKECYVFSHLHYRPSLANFSPRPAVHWFTYPELCRYGREAGFAQFYSLLDVLPADSPRISRSFFRRMLFRLASSGNWLKAAALSQVGSTIFMWKRGSPAE